MNLKKLIPALLGVVALAALLILIPLFLQTFPTNFVGFPLDNRFFILNALHNVIPGDHISGIDLCASDNDRTLTSYGWAFYGQDDGLDQGEYLIDGFVYENPNGLTVSTTNGLSRYDGQYKSMAYYPTSFSVEMPEGVFPHNRPRYDIILYGNGQPTEETYVRLDTGDCITITANK